MNIVKSDCHALFLIELIYVIKDDGWIPHYLNRVDYSIACCLHAINAAELSDFVKVTVVDLTSENGCMNSLERVGRTGAVDVIILTPSQLNSYCGSSKFNGAVGNNVAIRRSDSEICLLQASDCFFTPAQLKKLVHFFQSHEYSNDTYYLIPRVFLPENMPVFDLGVNLSCRIIDDWPAEQSMPRSNKFNQGGGYGSMCASTKLWKELRGLNEYPNFTGTDGDFFTRVSIANPVVNLLDFGIKMFKFSRPSGSGGDVRLKRKGERINFCYSDIRVGGNRADWGMASYNLRQIVGLTDFSYLDEKDDSLLGSRFRSDEAEFEDLGTLVNLVDHKFEWLVRSLLNCCPPGIFVVDDAGARLIGSFLKDLVWLNGVVCSSSTGEATVYREQLTDTDAFILSLRNSRSRVYKSSIANLALLWNNGGLAEKVASSRPIVCFPDLFLKEIESLLPMPISMCNIVIAKDSSIGPTNCNDSRFVRVANFDGLSGSGNVSVWSNAEQSSLSYIVAAYPTISWWKYSFSRTRFWLLLTLISFKLSGRLKALRASLRLGVS